MELTESQTIQLCTSPLLVYALVTGKSPAGDPRSQWRLLQALDTGLRGEDDLSATLVDALKSNLHKFYALFRTTCEQAGPSELLAGLESVRATLHTLAQAERDINGFRQALADFARHLATEESQPAGRERAATVVGLFT